MQMTINGQSFEVPDGANVSMVNNVLYVNGVKYDGTGYEDKYFKIEVIGGAVSVNVERGEVIVHGNVSGAVSAGTAVTCHDVTGDVKAGTGVRCGEVGGDVKAGTSVECENVSGSVKAGTSVRKK